MSTLGLGSGLMVEWFKTSTLTVAVSHYCLGSKSQTGQARKFPVTWGFRRVPVLRFPPPDLQQAFLRLNSRKMAGHVTNIEIRKFQIPMLPDNDSIPILLWQPSTNHQSQTLKRSTRYIMHTSFFFGTSL